VAGGTVKLVHAADIHLDSPLIGLSRYEGAPVERIREATRRAFVGLVELCLQQNAELLLLAGDLYDGSWKDYSTGLFFAAEMSRLREAGVQVVWIRGNHDAASQITQRLKLPDNVRELSFKKPDSALYEDLGLAVHGQGFASREVVDNIALAYQDPLPGLVNIGLLHTSVSGREGHEPYAPCRLEELVHKGYDYWALGHVHAREVLSSDPFVVFSGNLQGRHARETGEKGATLIEIDAGRVASAKPVICDVVRWAVCHVDISDCERADDVLEAVRCEIERQIERAEDRLLAARVVIEGSTRAHVALGDDPERWLHDVRAVATDAAYGDVWIEKVVFKTSRSATSAAAAATIRSDTWCVRSMLCAETTLGSPTPARLAGFGPNSEISASATSGEARRRRRRRRLLCRVCQGRAGSHEARRARFVPFGPFQPGARLSAPAGCIWSAVRPARRRPARRHLAYGTTRSTRIATVRLHQRAAARRWRAQIVRRAKEHLLDNGQADRSVLSAAPGRRWGGPLPRDGESTETLRKAASILRSKVISRRCSTRRWRAPYVFAETGEAEALFVPPATSDQRRSPAAYRLRRRRTSATSGAWQRGWRSSNKPSASS
jgi:DNA repair exonuclease SbcCD nuclease subunit